MEHPPNKTFIVTQQLLKTWLQRHLEFFTRVHG